MALLVSHRPLCICERICRELQREQIAAEESLKAPSATKDYSLKQGEKIKIKINTTRKSRDTGDDAGGDDAFGSSASPSSGKASSSNNGGGGTADLLGFSSSTYVFSRTSMAGLCFMRSWLTWVELWW